MKVLVVMIFGIVIFVRMSFARADRLEIFGIVQHRTTFAIHRGGTRSLVIARTASATATAATTRSRCFFCRIGARDTINQRFDIQIGIQLGIAWLAALTRRCTRCRARCPITAAARTTPATTAAAARAITRGFHFAVG
jgi:hypothetical protein